MNLSQSHTGHTFEKDLTKKDEILTHLLIITENLSKRLRKEKLKTNSIGITIRLNNFTDLSKQKTIFYTDSTIDIYNIVKELYYILRKKSNLPIRYLMVKFNSLDKAENTEQLNLFDIAEEKQKQESINTIRKQTKKEPIENWKLSLPSNDKTILDSVINPIAIHRFLDTFSLKKSNAINAVATISKLPRSDALDAVPIFIPIIKNIGAAISNPIIPIV